MSTETVEDADMSRIWPPKLNGTASAPATNPATITPSSQMPNTRQKSLRTNLNERAIAGKIGSRSSTMIDGVNDSMVPR